MDHARLRQLIRWHRLPAGFTVTIEHIYLPLARHLSGKAGDEPLLVSIHGAQGTGKSTLVDFLRVILETGFHRKVAAFSLDDFYLSRQHRRQLAQTIHPLLQTRGVPGTHDLDGLERALHAMLARRPCRLPRFDKIDDNPLPERHWQVVDTPVDIILFEGWCNHSPVQTDTELLVPVNRLEATEDADGVWRRHVNAQLRDYHRRLYDLCDMLVMLDCVDFRRVFDWRRKQERLNARHHVHGRGRMMENDTLRRFIQHFERITCHSLRHLPASADVHLPLNGNQVVESIQVREAASGPGGQ